LPGRNPRLAAYEEASRLWLNRGGVFSNFGLCKVVLRMWRPGHNLQVEFVTPWSWLSESANPDSPKIVAKLTMPTALFLHENLRRPQSRVIL
jgi:hypothetical protein